MLRILKTVCKPTVF